MSVAVANEAEGEATDSDKDPQNVAEVSSTVMRRLILMAGQERVVGKGTEGAQTGKMHDRQWRVVQMEQGRWRVLQAVRIDVLLMAPDDR